MRTHRVATVAAGITTIAAAAVAGSAATAMSLNFSWAGVSRCTSSPPAFMLSDVPEGTALLAFNMIDLNLPSFPHGGGEVRYQGADHIAAGSFSYQGPCPPRGLQHNYQWTVKALDAAGKTLATAAATRRFPPR